VLRPSGQRTCTNDRYADPAGVLDPVMPMGLGCVQSGISAQSAVGQRQLDTATWALFVMPSCHPYIRMSDGSGGAISKGPMVYWGCPLAGCEKEISLGAASCEQG